MATLHLERIHKSFGSTDVLRGIDLDIQDGELVVLVGPSGCGKSTLLRTIAGLELPTSGTLRIGGKDLTTAAPKERDLAMVFQSYALYPHLSVRKNLAFGLELRKTPKAEIETRIAEVSAQLGLDKLLDRLPRQLSGGQRQRVAMGRAIARRPQLFLFDEPLSNLDAALRSEVRVLIKKLHHKLKATMVYVTHDQVEAMTLADRLVVLSAGEVQQQGAPLEVYHRPASVFVATFLGSPAMNILPAKVENGRIAAKGLDLAMPEGFAADNHVLIGLRPHDLEVRPGGLHFEIEVVEAMGFETFAHGKLGDAPFTTRLPPEHPARPGQRIELGIAAEAIHLFDAKTLLALPRTEA